MQGKNQVMFIVKTTILGAASTLKKGGENKTKTVSIHFRFI